MPPPLSLPPLLPLAAALALCATSCSRPASSPDARLRQFASGGAEPARHVPCRPGDPLPRRGEEFIACGRLVAACTPIVTWLDPGGFDAYRPHRWFEPDAVLPSRPAPGCNEPSRLSTMRTPVGRLASEVRRPGDWTLARLREQLRLFVIHYDAAWTSENCFRVLHDVRGLSVHFLLDLDGTIFQSCDLKERARHAGAANDVAIGIEIAHPGPITDRPEVAAAYLRDATGTRLVVPERFGAPRTPNFVPRPARPQPVRGDVHGRALVQYDFTEEQYRALARLLAAVHRVFPRIRLEAPRGADGTVLTRALSPEELARFEGVLGHWHLSRHKLDPGPAFDWERVLTEARRLAAGGGP